MVTTSRATTFAVVMCLCYVPNLGCREKSQVLIDEMTEPEAKYYNTAYNSLIDLGEEAAPALAAELRRREDDGESPDSRLEELLLNLVPISATAREYFFEVIDNDDWTSKPSTQLAWFGLDHERNRVRYKSAIVLFKDYGGYEKINQSILKLDKEEILERYGPKLHELGVQYLKAKQKVKPGNRVDHLDESHDIKWLVTASLVTYATPVLLEALNDSEMTFKEDVSISFLARRSGRRQTNTVKGTKTHRVCILAAAALQNIATRVDAKQFPKFAEQVLPTLSEITKKGRSQNAASNIIKTVETRLGK